MQICKASHDQVSAPSQESAAISRLLEIEWDFASAKTGYLTHSLHPYPAKFIPQIPSSLIQELSSPGKLSPTFSVAAGPRFLKPCVVIGMLLA